MASIKHRPSANTPRRKGTPFTIYFSDKQAQDLNRISRERRVPKSELVRIGVDLLLAHISSGQLELPLGIELPSSIRQKQEQKS